MKVLDFEKPILDIYEKIDQLKQLSQKGNIDLSTEIQRMEKRADKLKADIYANLTPTQIVQVAKHANRPDTTSLVKMIFNEYVELHGDRLFRDDPALVGGLGVLDKHNVVVLGHQKGHTTKENIKYNWGMPNPEGYRKALRLMKLAEKFGLPIITFVDTPGAYPGIEAEERGQAEAIARNLKEMSGLKVPIITIVIGEGGSGGALGIAVSNKIYMLEYAVYSVISPEGCASILFRDATKADVAAETLKLTAKDIVSLGVADDIISEPVGGGHNDWEVVAGNIKKVLLKDLAQYKKITDKKILAEERYNKFRKMGRFSRTD